MILGNISCDLDPKVKGKGQIMYFLVNASLPKPLDVECTGQNFVSMYFHENASPPKPLDIAASNFVAA